MPKQVTPCRLAMRSDIPVIVRLIACFAMFIEEYPKHTVLDQNLIDMRSVKIIENLTFLVSFENSTCQIMGASYTLVCLMWWEIR